jgi:TetR/AcrR family transcriptional repressor of mexJK operon
MRGSELIFRPPWSICSYNADHFPDLGRSWYERGFERVLATLASSFQRLADRGLLQLDDPLLAAHHFVGQLLWIPVNQVTFTGETQFQTEADIERYAHAAVRAFLTGYGPPGAHPLLTSKSQGVA